MLGKTAGGLYWMFRYLERSENNARLVEAGFRIALTRSAAAEDEWMSVIQTAAWLNGFLERHDHADQARWSTTCCATRPIRPACCRSSRRAQQCAPRAHGPDPRGLGGDQRVLAGAEGRPGPPVRERDLPETLGTIRQQSALVRAALHGTMLRNDIYDFARIGTFLERADNTARILDVKYYVLLPSVMHVGSSLDNVQWETILRSVSAQRAYRWLQCRRHQSQGHRRIPDRDRRLPRSLAFCYTKLVDNLAISPTTTAAPALPRPFGGGSGKRLRGHTIDTIFDQGLHQFLEEFLVTTIGSAGRSNRTTGSTDRPCA
jgi:uncharacterized alpha-E superfamily protein